MLLAVCAALFAVCVIVSWNTRDAMANFPFLRGGKKAMLPVQSQKTLVDLRPWQTAEALAPLAVTAEENDFARQAEHLADHEVDQAFASALRKAGAEVQHRALTGEALALQQKVAQLQQLVKDDQVLVQSLTPVSKPQTTAGKDDAQPAADSDDLEIAKAQLGLDSDQLDDAQEDLARASGDNRGQIKSELAEHEAAMAKYDAKSQESKQTAVLSAARFGTLAGRIRAWNNQRSRYQLIRQAMQLAQSDIAVLTAEHDALEAKSNANSGPAKDSAADHATRLANLKARSAERQLLSIYDDRIQTQQQLAATYDKWSAQVLLQHLILFHLMFQSLALIALILICVVLCDSLALRLLANPSLDRRQMQTLRTIGRLGIQFIGALLVLFVIFGTPPQMPTVLGLATAGLTVALQDFILAFFGWFVLMGKNGLRIGDIVEIDGVGGEVIEVGLFRTTLLETGNWTDQGHPTGRHISFINSFAIRGKFFNFTTSGQWMWDEISVSVPASADTFATVQEIQKAVLEETEKDVRVAEREWQRGPVHEGLAQFSAAPVVNLRPSGAGIDILIRYVTRAPDRFKTRNLLYKRVIDMLHKPAAAAEQEQGPVVDNA